jgi:hypothetical protein
MAAKLSRAVLRLGNLLVEGPRTIRRSNAIGNKYVESSTDCSGIARHFLASDPAEFTAMHAVTKNLGFSNQWYDLLIGSVAKTFEA